MKRLKIFICTLVIVLFSGITSFAGTYSRTPDKQPEYVSDGLELCPGQTVQIYTGKNEGYIKVNGVMKGSWGSLNNRSPQFYNNVTSADSGTWEIRMYSSKKDQWLTPEYYKVTVSPHNIVNGKCTRCSRAEEYQHTWVLPNPTSYGGLPRVSQGSGGDVGWYWVFPHQGDKITHTSTSGHQNLYIDDIGKLWVEVCSRGDYGYYAGPLVLNTPGRYNYTTTTHRCRADEHTSWTDDCGEYIVSAHEIVNGTCVICGYTTHTHNYSTFVSYVTAPTCTASGTAT